MKRFEVTIERRVIVYAMTDTDAQAKVLDAIGFRKKAGVDESVPCKVIGVTELPSLLDEPRTPIIDRAPGMSR